MIRKFKVQRFDPEKDSAPVFKEYEVDCLPGWTVLDAMGQIKGYQDGSFTYRRSCRSGICGSCAMNICGQNRLACETQISELKGTIIIKPLPGFKIIKDMVVDMEPFFEALRRMQPWLIARNPETDKERIQSEKDFNVIRESTTCILCSSCTGSCPSFWADEDYVGPAALLKAYRFIFDTRDEGFQDRLPFIDNKHGLWRCHTIFNCVDACPKNINITDSISELKKKIILEKY